MTVEEPKKNETNSAEEIHAGGGDVKELQDKLSLAEKERDEYLNGWKRAKADLINAKKDWEEQIKGLGDWAKMTATKEFLPLVEALSLTKDVAGWEEMRQLAAGILKRNDVEETGAVGEKFNPEFHEAVAEVDGADGQIAEVVQKGYLFKGRLIRPAKVKVGKERSIMIDDQPSISKL